ncbi:MAG: pantetheine-phosphate adenylyltransferase [Candidatus Lightella neohaematopini]|nr:pantetheine-phosphate adenylyltransferase [Candidatus Lightella neohaematopini]MCV2524701.1 pantetheine-phosphate adenylyltransferase [Candidatus Lightella neohaematopini]
MLNKVIYPGTFDPLTNGHLNIITRAAKLFDNVIVAIANNYNKKLLFSLNERIYLAKQVTLHISNVTITSFNGLIVDFARYKKINVIIRGIRSTFDFNYEMQLAQINNQLMPKLENIFMFSDKKWINLSSTIVKEIAYYGGNIEYFLPKLIAHAVYKKFNIS